MGWWWWTERKRYSNMNKTSLKMQYFLVLLVLCLSAGHVEGHVKFKLNVPRVRLPYFDTLSVNFTLKVDQPGCYSWSVSRNDVVTIAPEPQNSFDHDGTQCSDSLVISTIPRVSPCCPASAIVFAKDVVTQETVRCDVIIDKISSIQILTTTKELHLEEAPSKFHIQGYGSKENELSTLDGIPFTWLLESPKNKETSMIIDPQSIIRFIPFTESAYKATAGISALEARRMQGDTILLEGIKTGSAEIIVKVNDALYKGLESRVRIIVVASLLLEPSEAFIVPGTVLSLTLWQIKHGQKYEIRLPSTVYQFSVDNETVATYDRGKSQVTALDYGEVKINVVDKNWVDELEEHSEALTARIYVREPKYLSLTVYPHKNWALVLGKPYEIQVDVYDDQNQKIYVGNNLFVKTKFDPMYFRVDYSSANGTYHVGVPIRGGSAYVTAELEKFILADGTEVKQTPQPRVKTEMEIFQNIAINPKETILPWDPNVMPKYELRWNPSGGNGNFIWSSTNSSVVMVSQSATGRSEWFGSANVTASSSVNSHIQGTARVHILPPTRMEIVEHIVEAEIGTAIQVPLAFYTIRPNDLNRTEVPYSSCGKLPISVTVADPNFVYDDKTHYPNLKPACVVLPIMGNALGSSLVRVTYSVGDKWFEDSVTVSTFKPLQTIEPENDLIVLAIGSSKQIAFEGGPRPLTEKHSGFLKTLKITNGTVASHRHVKIDTGLKDDVYVYEVLCKEIGDADAVFQIGNTKVSESSQPIIRIRVVRVICAEPSQMYFKVESTVKSKCPNDGSAAQVVRVAVPNYESSQISVIVKDKVGRKFDNITSLLIEWNSQPSYLDFATSTYALTESVRTNFGYMDTGKGLQTVIPNKKPGNVEIFAKVKGYREEVLQHYGLKMRKLAFNDDEFDLEHSMELTLVADVSVDPSSSVTLFNHPSSKAVVKVRDGSGYFELDTGTTRMINVSFDETNNLIEIKPLKTGKAKIILRDLCVSTKRETVIDVDVTGIGKIVVVSEEKIPLDEETNLTVSLHDQSGKLLSREIARLVQLSLVPIGGGILQVTPVESKYNPRDSLLHYKVVGKRVGVAEVVFRAYGGHEFTESISSIPKQISVFPPLKLQPKQITMLIGNSFQFQASDGPSDADVIFSTDDRDVAWIESSLGSVKAMGLGNSVVRGKAVYLPNQKVYSEDTVEVKVVLLTGLRIHMPLKYLYENEKIPVWIKGLAGKTEITPENLSSASPSLLSIEWIVSNLENAQIIHVFEDHSGANRIGKDLRVQFFARKVGNITLQVRAKYRGITISSQKLEIDIRKYPFGSVVESEENDNRESLWTLFLIFVSFFYYYMMLPLFLAIAIAIGTITYNGFMSGQYGKKEATTDTTLFITSPNFGSSPISYTPSPTSSTSSPRSQSSDGGGDGISSTPHQRRLYSISDQNAFSYSSGTSKTTDR